MTIRAVAAKNGPLEVPRQTTTLGWSVGRASNAGVRNKVCAASLPRSIAGRGSSLHHLLATISRDRMNTMELPQRASGILLHPSSLPGPHGIGTLGEQAYRFIDFLVDAGQSLWQILPLGPVGFGASPYSSFCSVAGNPSLVSLGRLVREGDLRVDELDPPFAPDAPAVDYDVLAGWKLPRLEKAAQRFLRRGGGPRRDEFERFCSEHEVWLEDYALFMALKEYFDRRAAVEGYWGATWNTYWDKDVALRDEAALQRWRGVLAQRVELQRVWQFFFFEQWSALRRYAHDRGITIVGDMPIFVALDSVDVWSAPELFQLDEHRQETLVAGVPPDYFSSTGQRWGNPLYNWEAMQANDFAWWIRRFHFLLQLVDVVRIDHFRGFAACWAIPAREETAVNGRWVKVPGQKLFETLRTQLGRLPFLAEDLGVITPDVEELRDHFGFPGMRVLQVGFENIEIGNIHLPEHHVENSVAYTGTHDNNTTLGWYRSLADHKQRAIADSLGIELRDPAWDMIRVALGSVARNAVIPMQDVLRLDSSARMNTPSTTHGNWQWRLSPSYAQPQLADELAQLTDLHNRSTRW